MSFRSSILVIGCILLAGVGLFAQSERGTISGLVQDSSGAVVPAARVTITNTATNAQFTTNSTDAGDYTAPNLAAGQYSVRVEKEGFKPALRTNVTLNAASSVRVDVGLEVGTAEQAIEISATAELLQTENAKSSTTITNKLVDELPLVVGGALRSPFDLAQLAPETKNFGDTEFQIGGGQASSYGITLDGVSAATTRALQRDWISYNAPSLEAITEFTVDTNGFKAEFGHAAGGIMTFSSKSGTNEFHGSMYEFLRNDHLDARRFFEAKRGIYKQHDFGVSAGGPIWIPKIIHGKDKSFFFASYEGFRNRVGANTATRSVPTPEMYEGDFSKWVDRNGNVIPVYDPATLTTDASGNPVRLQFPNNQIPKSRFDPLALKLINVYQQSGALMPNNGAAPGTSAYVRANYIITQGTEVNPWDKFSVKGDHIFSDKNRLSGYYGRNRIYKSPGPNGPPTLPGYYTDYNDLRNFSDVFRMSWDHTFRPTLLNHFYAGGNNWRQSHFSPNELKGNWKDKFCYPNVPDCNNNLSSVGFTEFYSWGGSSNNGSENTIYAFHDDLSWIKGRHSIKAGGMFQRNHYNGFGRQWDAGRVNFSFRETGVPGETSFTKGGGNSFASFLLGLADFGQIHSPRFISQQWPYFAGYVQDDFRVNRNLVLNVGIRWEATLPPVEGKDRWSDFSPTKPNPKADNFPGALVFAGTGTGREGTRSLADSYWRAFGPHVGFAYTLGPKTVVRAAYSRSFGAITTVYGSTHFRGFVQVASFRNQTRGVTPTFLYNQGMPFWPRPPFIDPSFSNGNDIPWWQGREATHPPTNDTWTFSIERQLTPSLMLDLSYNALAGSHLQSGLLNYNQVDPRYLQKYGALFNSDIDSPEAQAAGLHRPYPSFTGSVAQALRPFPQYQAIDTTSGGGDHSGHSTYHAGIVKLEKRTSSGLTFQSSYVFSKLITDSDNYWAGDNAMDHYNRRLEKSIGLYDVTHNFKLGLVYELPFGKGKKFLSSGVAGVVAGGWRLSSLHYYSSGRPVGLFSEVDLGVFAGGNRPMITTYENWRGKTARGKFDPQTDTFFQPASFFGPQPDNAFGNSTRFNPKLREFPNYNENISVAKLFPITEKMRLDLRWEAFNLFNRVRFGTGSNDIQDPNFGKLTSNDDIFNDPRRMQFALKLYW